MVTAIEALASMYDRSERRLAFRAESSEERQAWQTSLRAKLHELSGLDRMESWRREAAVQADAADDVGPYTRQRMLLHTAPDYWMPLYVLRPKGPGPFAPIIALHGHGRGKSDLVGIAANDEARQAIRRLNYAYADEAARRGYIVFAPDKRGFGERGGGSNTCLLLATSALLMGMSVIGTHTWDNQRLLDYIETRDDCRPGPVGCIGLSGGGGGTMWLAAMDERIGAAAISGHLAAYENGQFGCICNVVPQLLDWAERGDIGGLIAARPLLVESASDDECYSRERTLRAYEVTRRVYAVAGVPDRIDIDMFDGRHEWSGRKAWDWLARWL